MNTIRAETDPGIDRLSGVHEAFILQGWISYRKLLTKDMAERISKIYVRSDKL